MKKKKGWTITKLIATGSLAIIRFIIGLIFYTALLTSTGSVFAGISSLVIAPFFVVFTALVIRQFGSVAIFSLLRFFIELSIPTLWPKLVNFISAPIHGLVVDLLWKLLAKNEKLFSFAAGFIYNLIILIQTIVLYFTIGLPYTQNIPSFITTPPWLFILSFIFSLVGGFTGYAGYVVYRRLSGTSTIKRIQRH